MALRDQPYIPLYVQDIMTDEKLNECCAATHGIYIKGIMCLMHKSNPYGKILLRQKWKQSESKEKNFAIMLAKHLPYSVDEIFAAITELVAEDVCQFEGDYLVQKRMVHDGELSDIRAKAGKKGGEAVKNKVKDANDFATANLVANTEYANEYENENENLSKGGIRGSVFYDVEKLVLGNMIEFERICMSSRKSPAEAKEALRTYHLHLQEKESYPRTKQSLFAGFEKWLLNEKKFTNGSGNQNKQARTDFGGKPIAENQSGRGFKSL